MTLRPVLHTPFARWISPLALLVLWQIATASGLLSRAQPDG
jgi:hypothetical protein